jgi:antitoxin component YwqK of YwqJK toxin-antitoxin module
MERDLILCPLCKGEIPFNAENCNFCGAVLAPGPNRNTPILKGVVCKNCDEKNYGYDFCVKCNEPFVVDCPECGSALRLSDQKCEACGLSIRKFNRLRKKEDSGPTPDIKKYAMIGAGALAGILVLILLVSLIFSGGEPDEETPEQAANPRPVDRDSDGQVDRWEHTNENGVRDWVKDDEDGNGVVDRISYLDSNGTPRKVVYDANGDERYEKVEFYRDGVLRSARHFEGADAHLVTKLEFYAAPGKLLNTYLDDNEDGVFEKHYKFDKNGRVHIEAFDSKGQGFIDTYLFYNKEKKIVARGADADGDGTIEKMAYLSSDGVTIREEIDSDGDGWPEKRTMYHLTGKTRWIEYDTDADGNMDKFESYTKDGKYARTGFDTNGDGKVDRWK